MKRKPALAYAAMAVMALISIAPLAWVFISSLKSYSEINSSAFSLPARPRFDNYVSAFRHAPILRYFANSVVIVGAGIALTVTLVAMSAYAAARFRFRAKPVIIALFAVSLLLPAQSITQPLFALYTALNLFDTKAGLVLVYAAMGIPIAFFVMYGYYATLPLALEESAYIDGAGFFKTFTRIILPMAKPGLATVVILQFTDTWNEFYYALMLTSGNRARTVPIALNYYMSAFANNYSALFAAVVVTVAPTIVFFVVMQRQVIDGLTSGAVKG
ncbi:MAG: carbohydrate ABC transporter permease [Oscillospiraceae bacterium]|jgi:raffinose/stachyose/melibiose transport system permease protein|nr:carbohydrate ABC transporter permease [Oscillospiraceae bacterium]